MKRHSQAAHIRLIVAAMGFPVHVHRRVCAGGRGVAASATGALLLYLFRPM